MILSKNLKIKNEKYKKYNYNLNYINIINH